MAAVFVVALIVLMILGFFVCGLVRGQALTAIDRTLGFIYGLLRGYVVVCVIYMVAVIVLWPDIDTAQVPKPVAANTPPVAEQAQDKDQQDKDHTTTPDLLLTAKTRPALAYGATVLKGIIPKEMLDKAVENAEHEKEEAIEKAKAEADKNAREEMLNRLSTPEPPGAGGGKPIQ